VTHAQDRAPADHLLPARHLPLPAAKDGRPAFAQTFFDDTAMSTFLADVFNISVLPISVYPGDTCTLAGYSESPLRGGRGLAAERALP
jgi:hypothetical protein